ncbi:hypothetical protein C5E44_34815 [Nocardia nova]|uniref:hypothetical protein n=1 Tax=Nocardia nova TaxID=37330 RepID=UPI000CEA538B|nr:hypothetical protein C5E44_34815 [Nocardia nova]
MGIGTIFKAANEATGGKLGSALLGAAVNGGAEFLHSAASDGIGNIDWGRIGMAGGIGAAGSLAGDAVAGGISRKTGRSVTSVGTEIETMGKGQKALEEALKKKASADAKYYKNNASNSNSKLRAKSQKADQELADQLGVPLTDVAGKNKYKGLEKEVKARGKTTDKETQELENRKKELEAKQKGWANSKGAKNAGWKRNSLRAAGIAAATGLSWQSPRGGSDSGGSDGGGDKQPGGKPPATQQVTLTWGGSQYMDSPAKEPIAPDPGYTATGTGFLLYPQGLNEQIRRWYVG